MKKYCVNPDCREPIENRPHRRTGDLCDKCYKEKRKRDKKLTMRKLRTGSTELKQKYDVEIISADEWGFLRIRNKKTTKPPKEKKEYKHVKPTEKEFEEIRKATEEAKIRREQERKEKMDAMKKQIEESRRLYDEWSKNLDNQ